MSKISCVAAALNVRWTFVKRGPERSVDKARVSCVFANMCGAVLNSYTEEMKGRTKMLTLDKFEEASEKVKEVTLETKLIYSD